MKLNVVCFFAAGFAVYGIALYLEERKIKNEVRRMLAHANLITKEAV